MVVRGPEFADQIEPFLRIGIAGFVIVGQAQAKRLVFRLVPARDDVQARAAMADLVDGGDLLGHDDRMVGGGVDGGEDGDVLRRGQQACGPGHRLQHAAVEIGLAAIADPARDRQHEVDPGRVQHLRQLQVVVPAVVPARGDLCGGHPRRAVGREGAKAKPVAREHRVLRHDCSPCWSFGDILCLKVYRKFALRQRGFTGQDGAGQG